MNRTFNFSSTRSGYTQVAVTLIIAAAFLPQLGTYLQRFKLQALFPLGLVCVVFVHLLFWPLRLVREAVLLSDGSLEFKRIIGRRLIRVADVRRVRPLFGTSRETFAVEHRSGTDWVGGDRTMVALFVRSLRAQNPSVEAVGLPTLPDDPPGGAV